MSELRYEKTPSHYELADAEGVVPGAVRPCGKEVCEEVMRGL